MRVIFMGTPDFAVSALEEIVRCGHEVVLVVTQPDKPKGRGNCLQYPPVKECALKHGIEVFQPRKIREDANVEYLKKICAGHDRCCGIRSDTSQKYSGYAEILLHQTIHASLLPKYRGAAPIQWAVINGDPITGVTIQRMDIGIDTGDMIAKREVRIAEDETGGSLFDKLSEVGAKLCVETMEMLEKGTATFTPQNNEASTHTSMITKELGNIDWNKPAAEIERLIRGLNPWPSAYTHLNNKTFKIWKAEVTEGYQDCQPGCIAKVGKKELVVQTGEGALSLLEVQLEGKKRMEAGAFLRGYPVEEGTLLKN